MDSNVDSKVKMEIKKEENNSLSENLATILQVFDSQRKQMHQKREHADGKKKAISCYHCGKEGHISTYCRDNPKSIVNTNKIGKKEEVNVTEDSKLDVNKFMKLQEQILERIGEAQCLVRSKKGPNATLRFCLENGKSFVGTLDSAADRSTMSHETAKKLGIKIGPYTGPRLWSATGHQLKMVGTAKVICWPESEPGMKIEEEVHIAAGGTSKTLIGFEFLTRNGFCLLPNIEGEKGWTVVTQDHIILSKKGRQQFASSREQGKMEQELIMLVDMEREEVCGITEEPVTFEEIMEAFLGDEGVNEEVQEVMETNELEYIERKEQSDEQLVEVVNATKIDKTATYHEKADEMFNKEFMKIWSTKFSEERQLIHDPIKIELKEGHTLTKMEPYRSTPEKKAAWIEFEEKALKDGRIFPSNAPHCVPGLILEKPERDQHGNKRWRPLVDLRPLNDAVKDVCYPMPNIEDAFAEHKGMKIFTKLDLKDGFHQIRLEEGSHDLTTCLLYTSPSPRDATLSRMPSSA